MANKKKKSENTLSSSYVTLLYLISPSAVSTAADPTGSFSAAASNRFLHIHTDKKQQSGQRSPRKPHVNHICQHHSEIQPQKPDCGKCKFKGIKISAAQETPTDHALWQSPGVKELEFIHKAWRHLLLIADDPSNVRRKRPEDSTGGQIQVASWGGEKTLLSVGGRDGGKGAEARVVHVPGVGGRRGVVLPAFGDGFLVGGQPQGGAFSEGRRGFRRAGGLLRHLLQTPHYEGGVASPGPRPKGAVTDTHTHTHSKPAHAPVINRYEGGDPRHSLRPALVALPLGLTEVPDEDADHDDDYSSHDQPDQEGGHVHAALLALICAQRERSSASPPLQQPLINSQSLSSPLFRSGSFHWDDPQSQDYTGVFIVLKDAVHTHRFSSNNRNSFSYL